MCKRVIAVVIGAISLSGCLSVRPSDLDAWVGQPVAALDHHPAFIAMRLERKMLPDGTEVRDYVNGGNVRRVPAWETKPACHNIFFVKDGVVTRYAPTGAGGVWCFTDDSLRPGG